MSPYIVIFFIICLLKNNKYINILCFLIIFIFMGSRYEVGQDWVLYYSIAENVEFSKFSLFQSWTEKITPLKYGWGHLYRYLTFEFSNRILYKIVWLFKWPQLIIYLYSFLCLIFIKMGLEVIEKKNIKYSWLLFFSFPEFFLLDTNLMRQAVAISIIFYSYRYIIKKEKYKFIFFVILATTFHTSAIFCIGLYLVNYVKKMKKITIFFLYVIFFFLKDIVIFILQYISIVPQKYTGYLKLTFLGGIKTNYLIYFLGLVFILFLVRKTEKRKLIMIVLIGFYLNVIFKNTGYLVIRTRVYFLIFSLYLTPILLQKNKILKNIFIFFCFAILILSLINDRVSRYGGQYVPYKIYFLRNNKEY